MESSHVQPCPLVNKVKADLKVEVKVRVYGEEEGKRNTSAIEGTRHSETESPSTDRSSKGIINDDWHTFNGEQ